MSVVVATILVAGALVLPYNYAMATHKSKQSIHVDITSIKSKIEQTVKSHARGGDANGGSGGSANGGNGGTVGDTTTGDGGNGGTVGNTTGGNGGNGGSSGGDACATRISPNLCDTANLNAGGIGGISVGGVGGTGAPSGTSVGGVGGTGAPGGAGGTGTGAPSGDAIGGVGGTGGSTTGGAGGIGGAGARSMSKDSSGVKRCARVWGTATGLRLRVPWLKLKVSGIGSPNQPVPELASPGGPSAAPPNSTPLAA